MGKSDVPEGPLLRKYNIHFHNQSSALPSSHFRSFRTVQKLGAIKYSDYFEKTQKLDDSSQKWQWEIILRACRLQSAAENLQRIGASELQWRIEVEDIVYSRSHLEDTCQRCEGSIWRSEIEVTSEEDGPIGAYLKKRRNERCASCTCEESVQFHLANIKPRFSSLFHSVVDETFIHTGVAKEELRNRRPDRVFGLRRTASLESLLKDNGCLDIPIKGTLNHEHGFVVSPFGAKPLAQCPGKYLLLPFLIGEAKSDTGSTFDACGLQTAFPIWKLLTLQLELEKVSPVKLVELGGPLVWYMANRGDEWRVYGCYTKVTEGQSISFHIHELWGGHLKHREEALQLLHIVDYIFDWATDLYLPLIRSQLSALNRHRHAQKTCHKCLGLPPLLHEYSETSNTRTFGFDEPIFNPLHSIPSTGWGPQPLLNPSPRLHRATFHMSHNEDPRPEPINFNPHHPSSVYFSPTEEPSAKPVDQGPYLSSNHTPQVAQLSSQPVKEDRADDNLEEVLYEKFSEVTIEAIEATDSVPKSAISTEAQERMRLRKFWQEQPSFWPGSRIPNEEEAEELLAMWRKFPDIQLGNEFWFAF